MTLTGDGLFIGLLILGMFFMIFSNRRRNVLVSLATFIIWFALGLWLFFSTSAPIGFGETWKDVLGWGFLVLAFLPFLFLKMGKWRGKLLALSQNITLLKNWIML